MFCQHKLQAVRDLRHYEEAGSTPSQSHSHIPSVPLQLQQGAVPSKFHNRASSAQDRPGGSGIIDFQQPATARSAASEGAAVSSQTDRPAALPVDPSCSNTEGGAEAAQLTEDRKRQGSAYSNSSGREEYVRVTSADGVAEVGKFTSCYVGV